MNKKHLAIEVTNKYESEFVQRALFEMGFGWAEGYNYFNPICGFPFFIVAYISTPATLAWSKDCLDNLIDISFSEFFRTYAYRIERFPDYVAPKTAELDHFKSIESHMRDLIWEGAIELTVPFMGLKPKQEDKPMTNKIEKLILPSKDMPKINGDVKYHPPVVLGLDIYAINDKINEIIDVVNEMKENIKIFNNNYHNLELSIGGRLHKLEFPKDECHYAAYANNLYEKEKLEIQLSKLEKGCWYLVISKNGIKNIVQFEKYKDDGDFHCSCIFLLDDNIVKYGTPFVKDHRLIKNWIKSIEKII